MASRREYEMLFQLNAELGGSYSASFQTAKSSIAQMQSEIMSLNKTQSDISAYEKQQGAVERTQEKLKTLQQQYNNIQKEIDETGSSSSALKNQLLTKEQQIEKTTRALDGHTEKLGQMGQALNEAGVDTGNLTGESERLKNKVSELKDEQETAAEEAANFGNTASAAFVSAGQALVAAGIVKGLKEIAEYAYGAAQAAMVFESGMASVAKTTELSDAELAAMGAEMKALSTEIPITTGELAELGETAGQLGVAKDNLLDFATVMGMLSTATNMTAEHGATMLAQFANITQMDASYYSNLASAIVDLGNNFATSEQKILDMSQGMAAAANMAGFSETDILGLSTAVSSLGIEAQAGGSSISRLISTLYKATETGGSELEKFAAVAGMTSEEFTTAWGNNAVGALDAFIQGLNNTEQHGKSAIVLLDELGIRNVRETRAILSLANAGDVLSSAVEMSNSAWQENTALVAEAELRYGTTESQLVMLQNAYNNFKIALGDSYLPVLRKVFEIGTGILNLIAEFAEKNPGLVKGISVFVGVVGVTAAALLGYTAAAKAAAIATAALTAAIPGVNVIAAVTAGVAALAGVVAGFAGGANAAANEIGELSAASRANFYEAEYLRQEYVRVADAMGETSAEAQLLKQKLDETEAGFEANKMTAEELVSSHKMIVDSHQELKKSYEEVFGGIEKEEDSVVSLTARLRELMSVERKSSAVKQEIVAIVDLLNQKMPELNLHYDKQADSLSMTADAIKEIARVENERLRNAAKYERLLELLDEESALQENLETQTKNRIALEKEHRELIDKAAGSGNSDAYYHAIRRSTSALEDQVEIENEAREAYEENQKEIERLSGEVADYTESTEGAASAVQTLQGELAELAEKYEEAYDAALESVQGQYQLWDEAEKVVAVSAGSINSALDSQIGYWEDYNENLESLGARTAEIDGLSEVIASFADGSAESVNAIAGLAAASDEELGAMVLKYRALQEQQDKTAESLAEFNVNMQGEFEEIVKTFDDAVKDMDKSEEMYKQAQHSIDGFIAGAGSKIESVVAMYRKVARAAKEAVDTELKIESPSKVMFETAEMTWDGYIKGTEAMRKEVELAAAETVAFGFGWNAAPAESASDGGTQIILTVSPQNNFYGNRFPEEQIRQANNDMKDAILEVLEDVGIDKVRRGYI